MVAHLPGTKAKTAFGKGSGGKQVKRKRGLISETPFDLALFRLRVNSRGFIWF